MNTDKIFHGGDPRQAEAEFGRPEAGWLDLSTGINPIAYPLDGLALDGLRHLPTGLELDALEAAARRRYGVPERARLISAPGSQAILQILPFLRPPARVCVLSPTYVEHAHGWRAAGHEVREVAEWAALAEGDIAVIGQPNNPDGLARRPAEILDLADHLATSGGLLVVDEAFCDLDPALSTAGSADRPGLLVLRSFGKFFGLAGLRLGFAAGTPEIATPIAQRLGPWAVSSLAAETGRRALADDRWIEDTRARLAGDRKRLDQILGRAGMGVIGGTDLFLLTEDDRAPDLYAHLAGAGILTRPFPEKPAWLRFGLPGEDSDWARLEAALEGFQASRQSIR